jgi:hypothetical protein
MSLSRTQYRNKIEKILWAVGGLSFGLIQTVLHRCTAVCLSGILILVAQRVLNDLWRTRLSHLYDSAPPNPLPPLLLQVVSISQSFRVSPV